MKRQATFDKKQHPLTIGGRNGGLKIEKPRQFPDGVFDILKKGRRY